MEIMGEESPTKIDAPYELFILLLSLLSVGNLFFFIFPGFNPSAEDIIHIFDGMLSIVFMADFILRMVRTESRFDYLFKRFGWADLLGSLPFAGIRIFRLFRIIRATTYLQRIGPDGISRTFSEKRAESALLFVIFLVIVIIEIGSTLILQFELPAEGSNIKTASDALWWSYVTIATVGYGDLYPVTNLGRLVGICLMTCGVSIFATLAGFLSNKLLTPKKSGDQDREVNLKELMEMITEQHQVITEIRSDLHRIEEQLDQKEQI